MNKIEVELEKEIRITAKCDEARILKVVVKSNKIKNDQEQVFLVNRLGLKIEAEDGMLLFNAIKVDNPSKINETTRNRHLKVAKMSKQFGFRVTNAVFVPFVIECKNVKNGVTKKTEDQIYLLCLFNHQRDFEIEGLLDPASKVSENRSGAKYLISYLWILPNTNLLSRPSLV